MRRKRRFSVQETPFDDLPDFAWELIHDAQHIFAVGKGITSMRRARRQRIMGVFRVRGFAAKSPMLVKARGDNMQLAIAGRSSNMLSPLM